MITSIIIFIQTEVTGDESAGTSTNKASIDLADKLKIKQVMAHAQKMIEERKKKLNVGVRFNHK